MSLKTLSVIGAGQMGVGIAQVCAQAGYDVVLNDISDEALSLAMAGLDARLTRLVDHDRLSRENKSAIQSRICSSRDYARLGAADLVIEAASENEAVKTKIFQTLPPHLGDNTLLASNTSSLSITRLAARTDRPERFMGVHFMNPVPVMQLVELIRGIATDRTTFEICCEFVERLACA